ncbi:MAG: 1-deoxy-D-xylulose-5-phosphate reductoisomerase, partial [Bacteroidota bacterium]
MEQKRKIAILGSTGSIGTQTLEVISEQSEHFQVELLTAGNNYELLIDQAKRFNPSTVVIG